MPAAVMELPDLTGRTVVVTGASSGIGAAAARAFASAGARVVPVGRSPERTAAIGRELGVDALVVDFADLVQVRILADRILERCPRIDVMAHNAGGIVPRRIGTVDGHELTFQVNHLAPFLLQHLLGERIAATPGSRVILTSSAASRYGKVDLEDLDSSRGRYRPFKTYATSKLENILFMRELSRRLRGTDTTATAFHPGVVATGFARDSRLAGLAYRTPLRHALLISPEEGAGPLLHLATWPDPNVADGHYFDRLTIDGTTAAQANNDQVALELWNRSMQLANAGGTNPNHGRWYPAS